MSPLAAWLLAACAVLGGLDRLLGNRLGLGARFEVAFDLLGPTALSMAGILVLTPVLSELMQAALAPALLACGIDPSLAAGLLAIDMGGYPLAQALAADSRMGLFSGVVIASTLGCTLSFTAPVGFGLLPGETRQPFAQGLMLGLPSLAAAAFSGGLLCGLPLRALLLLSLPPLLLAPLCLLLRRKQRLERMLRLISFLLRAAGTIGLSLGAVAALTGSSRFSALMPLQEAMQVCCSICITMLGSLPAAQLLLLGMKKLTAGVFSKRLLPEQCTAVLAVGLLSATPAFAMLKPLSAREQAAVSAFLVCGASTVVHLSFVLAAAPQAAGILLAAKLIGGLAGFCTAWFVYPRLPRRA